MILSELKPKPPKILLWGPLGSGKTALALTGGARAEVADIGEDGLTTGLTLEDTWTAERKKVSVKQFHNLQPHRVADACSRLKQYVTEISDRCTKGTYPYDMFILDSISELQRLAVQQIMYNSGKIGKQIEIQHWGLAFNEMEMILDIIKSLPIVVIAIGHEQFTTLGDGDDKIDRVELALQGKNQPTRVPRGFDEIWYMRVRPQGGGKNAFVVQTQRDAVIVCRSRGNLPNMTDVSIGIWGLIAKLGYKPPERKEPTAGAPTPAPTTKPS